MSLIKRMLEDLINETNEEELEILLMEEQMESDLEEE